MEVEGEQNNGRSIAGPEWPMQGKVEFENISLHYEPGLSPALKNVSFKIEGGSKVMFCIQSTWSFVSTYSLFHYVVFSKMRHVHMFPLSITLLLPPLS